MFLKFTNSVACIYCRHVGRFSNITKIKGLTDVTSPAQLYLTRSKSVLTRESTVSSISSALRLSPPFRQAPPNVTNTLLFAEHSPNQGLPFASDLVLFRNYSSSPQTQQREDSPDSKGRSQRESDQNEGLSQGRTSAVDDAEEESSKGIIARFKDAYKHYGKVLIGVHLATSSVWFGTFFYAAYAGIDVVPLLKWMGASDRFISPFESSGIGNVAVAYLLYKVATPARYTVTILGTKYMVEHLRKMGYMEPIPEGARIRDFVKESREQVREKYEDFKEDVKEKKDEYKEKYDEKLDNYKEKMEEKKSELKEKRSELREKLKGPQD